MIYTHSSIEAFYAEDTRRRRSPERRFGRQWYAGGSTSVTHRVSYVDATGELYAIANSGADRNKVALLAQLQTSPCENCDAGVVDGEACVECGGSLLSRYLVEAALYGWQTAVGTPDSIAWLLERIATRGRGPTVFVDAAPPTREELGWR